jgi:hypothetical protein
MREARESFDIVPIEASLRSDVSIFVTSITGSNPGRRQGADFAQSSILATRCWFIGGELTVAVIGIFERQDC